MMATSSVLGLLRAGLGIACWCIPRECPFAQWIAAEWSPFESLPIGSTKAAARDFLLKLPL
jgi:hypothetical protein